MYELRLPELGENIETADIATVLVAVGDRVEKDQPVIEVETEKASLEVPSETAGRVAEIRVRPGETIKVGQVILIVEGGGEQEPPAPAPQEQEKAAPPERGAEEVAVVPESDRSVVAFLARPRRGKPEIGVSVPAAPSVRALARELGVDVTEVVGSGPASRITRDDVKAHAKGLIRRARKAAPGAPGAARVELPDFTQWGEVERQSLSALRRATAGAMASAWATVPHVTQFDRADVTELEDLRRKLNLRPEAAERRLALTAIVVKMAAAALHQFPKFNASIDLDSEEVVLKRYVHVGVAVDTERGLLVPVIRDADRKGLFELAAELHDLAERSRTRRVRPEELRGGTFTVTNLGGLGTTYFSPIVNWPEVAILGVGRAEMQPVYAGAAFRPRLILPLSLSYDHRLIDGADAARFLRWIAEALEQPLLLLLDERR